MNSLLVLLLPLLAVFFILLFPVRQRRLHFDEKTEAIKIYQEEVKQIQLQADKGLIDNEDKAQLLEDLDKKSALAITAIEKKTFTYQKNKLPLIVIAMVLILAVAGYYSHYQRNGVMTWQLFNERFHSQITEGLFDEQVVRNFVAEHETNVATMYCFAMQRELLAKYDTDADALASLAACYAVVGYPQLAEQAITRGLKKNVNHASLNYLSAELQYGKTQRLSKESRQRLLSVLKTQPNQAQAIRLLAIDSLSQKDYPSAKSFFTQLRQLAPANEPELLAALDRLLQEIDTNLLATGQNTKSLPKLSPNHPPIMAVDAVSHQSLVRDNAPSLSHSQTDNIKNTENETKTTDAVVGAPSVRLSVQLSEAFSKTLTGNKVLFIIIKTPEGQLLNASKYIFNVKQSLTIEVSDNTAGMMQLAPMAGHSTFNVVARISLNDSAMASSGDLTSAAHLISLPQQQIATIVIDQKVP